LIVKLPWKKQKEFFSEEEKQQLVAAVQQAEKRTSGEIRIFVESRCRFVDPVDRAKELFLQLGMAQTKERNATLIYIAFEDHQLAILGDEGIHQKVGQHYWEEEVATMIREFRSEHVVDGICNVVKDIGEALTQHFPYNSETDKNELPDEIVFGK
jgi:uncharacterized membrane protein